MILQIKTPVCNISIRFLSRLTFFMSLARREYLQFLTQLAHYFAFNLHISAGHFVGRSFYAVGGEILATEERDEKQPQ